MRASALLASAVITGVLATPVSSRAAVGCTLNDPDRDIMRVFPKAEAYITDFIAIDERGGDSLAALIEADLGDTLDPTFESLDVPYAFYTVTSGGSVIGRLHGVNQKGTFGGMQLILATDPEGTIVDFYYQKLSSPEAGAFRSDAFTNQFDGLELEDFLAGDEGDAGLSGTDERGRVEAIKDPSESSADDFAATLRGIRKNLLLLREFMLRSAEDSDNKEDTSEND